MSDWIAEVDNLWSKTVTRQELVLVLRVFRDDKEAETPWIWAVAEQEEEVLEFEVALGKAPTREAAMAAAEAVAAQA